MSVFSAIEKAAGVLGGFAAKLIRRYGYPKAIQQRGIDMRSGLHNGASGNLRIVRMVQDRLHVIQIGVDASGQVRRTEIPGDAKSRELLERICWMWRKTL